MSVGPRWVCGNCGSNNMPQNANCYRCQAAYQPPPPPPQAVAPIQAAPRRSASPDLLVGLLILWGILTLAWGNLMLAYYFMFFTTTVASDSGSGQINNIGLIADRQCGVLVGAALIISGLLFLLLGAVLRLEARS